MRARCSHAKVLDAMILNRGPHFGRHVPAFAAGTSRMGNFDAPTMLMGLLNDLLLSPVTLLMFRARPKEGERWRRIAAVVFPAMEILAASTVSLAQDAREIMIKVDDLTNRTYQ